MKRLGKKKVVGEDDVGVIMSGGFGIGIEGGEND